MKHFFIIFAIVLLLSPVNSSNTSEANSKALNASKPNTLSSILDKSYVKEGDSFLRDVSNINEKVKEIENKVHSNSF